MNHRNYARFLFAAILVVSFWCGRMPVAKGQPGIPSDKKITKTALKLYGNLGKMAAGGRFLFGHQDDLAYGVHWKYEPGRSDVKDVCGDYPALFGWELGGVEKGLRQNLDGVPFNKMRKFIQEGYRKGSVITISWHGSNPLTGKTAWDPHPGTVASLLPGGEKNLIFKKQLDRVAIFLKSLKDDKGAPIPLLFRPFHELSGGWFWWGVKYTPADDYKRLFRYTIDYLRNIKGLHQLLIVYNTGGEFNSAEKFLERYPGDAYADVLSFDQYQSGDPRSSDRFAHDINQKLKIMSAVAAQKQKLFALAETGYEAIPYENWWTKTLLPAIGDNRISYVLVWRNQGYHEGMKKMHYYAPYKGQSSAPDFIDFFKTSQTVFQKEAAQMKLYQ
jgi:mannan endo-1,4-beta-mannosidase